MQSYRIYTHEVLEVANTVTLSEQTAHHIIHVLRMSVLDPLILLNGDGHYYHAQIQAIHRKHLEVYIHKKEVIQNESPLDIHLVQGVSRGDKMDYTLQKSVELGVKTITPLFSERCGVKLQPERLQKKQQHWQQVIISACEQSGRAVIPKLSDSTHIKEFIRTLTPEDNPLILNPHYGESIKSLPKKKNYTLLIGPEGGFSDSEVEQLQNHHCKNIQLGPRILRTETASLAIISLLQGFFGDF